MLSVPFQMPSAVPAGASLPPPPYPTNSKLVKIAINRKRLLKLVLLLRGQRRVEGNLTADYSPWTHVGHGLLGCTGPQDQALQTGLDGRETGEPSLTGNQLRPEVEFSRNLSRGDSREEFDPVPRSSLCSGRPPYRVARGAISPACAPAPPAFQVHSQPPASATAPGWALRQSPAEYAWRQ